MHTFGLAIKMKEHVNYIEKRINAIKMRLRLDLNLEDVDVLTSFLKNFKPEAVHFHVDLPARMTDDKLKKFLQTFETLDKKVGCFLFCFKDFEFIPAVLRLYIYKL